MPIDPRIALQAIGIQAPDVLGAMAQGQQYRQNQMAQQAAQATAQRNAMIRQRAAATDFTNPDAVNMFVREAGPDATPYLEAAGAGDTLFSARAAESRAAGDYTRKARGEDQGFMQRAIGAVYTDPSDANIAAVSEQAIAAGVPREQMTAYAARILAAPPEQRRALLAGELATSTEGLKLLERFTPAYDMQNAGGSIIPVQTNPLAPGAVPPSRIAVTASPNRPVIVQTADGIYSATPGGGPAAPVTDANGNILQPYDSTPNAPANAGDAAKTQAAEGLRSTLDSLRGYYSALNESGGIVSTERGGGENLVASAGASLPGRVLGRTFGSRDQTQRDNIQTAIPMIVASLKDLTGMSAQQMNSNVELQLFLNTVGDPSQSIETVNEALTRFERYVDRMAGASPGGAAAGGANLPPVGPEGARVRSRSNGTIMVSRSGQWVPE
jgi:hypothetical protein